MPSMSKALVTIMGAFLMSTISVVTAKPLYDSVKSYVFVLNQKNFDAQVTKNRQKGITIVNFYKESGKLPKIYLEISNYRWSVQGSRGTVRKLRQGKQGNVPHHRTGLRGILQLVHQRRSD